MKSHTEYLVFQTKKRREMVHITDEIEQIVRQGSFSPLRGLVGVPMVNVLEINLALEDHFQKSAETAK